MDEHIKRRGDLRIEIEDWIHTDGTVLYDVTLWQFAPSVLEEEPVCARSCPTVDEAFAFGQNVWKRAQAGKPLPPRVDDPRSLDDAWSDLATEMMTKGASLLELVEALKQLLEDREAVGLPTLRHKTADQMFNDLRDLLGTGDMTLEEMLQRLRRIRDERERQ